MANQADMKRDKSLLPIDLGGKAATSPMLHEMLRSFSALAAAQNLSEAVRMLGASRQTIRRHVTDLEQLVGEALMVRYERQYQLTQRGRVFADDALVVLGKTNDLIAGTMQNEGRLASVQFAEETGGYFMSKQHSLLSASQSDVALIADGFCAWSSARGRLEHPGLSSMADYFVTYRPQASDWIYVHVGQKSSLATFLGSVWAQSEVGVKLSSDMLSNPTDRYVLEAYNDVIATGTPRIDHIATKLPRTPDGKPEPINYQRLLLACQFPNGEPALVVLSVRTNKLDVGKQRFELMSSSMCMESARVV